MAETLTRMNGPRLLAKCLKDADETKAEFARRSGVPHSTISFLLSGSRTRVALDTAVAIKIATGGKVPIEAWARPLKGAASGRPTRAA